ncbi:MAG: hypothetical protein AB7P49_16775, partial [Bdellovibrionales bacterium]
TGLGAAVVSGKVALVLQRYPHLPPHEIGDIIRIDGSFQDGHPLENPKRPDVSLSDSGIEWAHPDLQQPGFPLGDREKFDLAPDTHNAGNVLAPDSSAVSAAVDAILERHPELSRSDVMEIIEIVFGY